MKNRKISLLTSSIAACAIFASVITFNGFAANSNNTEIPKEGNSITAVNQKAMPATDSQEQTLFAAPVSINTTSAKNTTCPATQNTQNSSNMQTNIKSANISNTVGNLQNAINNANCDKTTAKTRNTSALQSKIDELLKSFTASSTAKTDNNSSAVEPAVSAATTGSYSAYQKRVLELVNKERTKRGLKPLKMNAQLAKTATLKSQDMARRNYFSHTSPTYGSPFTMMKNFGIKYRTAGENIAMGQTSPEQVMRGWMNSPGHRANILKPSFTQIGVGVAKNSRGRLYWTQQFIG